METPDQIMLRVKELEREMEKKNNIRRVIYLATALYDATLDLEGRIQRGREIVKVAPHTKPFLEGLEMSMAHAQFLLTKIERQPRLTYLAARAIFDAEETTNDSSTG